MIPFFTRYFSWLPKKFLKFTECGYTFRVCLLNSFNSKLLNYILKRASAASIINENEVKTKSSSNTQKIAPLAYEDEILKETKNLDNFGEDNPAFLESDFAETKI
jgi:hypothetical protein